MEFDLTEDQEFFAQTTRKFLAAECPLTTVRALEANPTGFDPGYWRAGAGLGWTSMLVPETDGGGSLSEHGLLDLALVAEEMGRLVAPGPLVPVNVVAAAIAEHGTDAQRAEFLPGLLDGSLVAAWVAADAAVVEAGAQADVLLVTTPDGQRLVAADDPAVTVTPMGGLDLVRRFATVRVEGRPGQPLGDGTGAADAAAQAERQLQIAVVLQCAETCGVVDRVFEFTLEYVGDRYSFGRPLSSYQALKHRFADMKMWLEACHATATAAAHAVAERADNAGELISVAKSYIGTHATDIIQDCVQMHGGIGVTWEHDLHLYLRRAVLNRSTYGTPAEHRERIASLLLGAA